MRAVRENRDCDSAVRVRYQSLMRAVRENRDCNSAVRVRYQEAKDHRFELLRERWYNTPGFQRDERSEEDAGIQI